MLFPDPPGGTAAGEDGKTSTLTHEFYRNHKSPTTSRDLLHQGILNSIGERNCYVAPKRIAVRNEENFIAQGGLKGRIQGIDFKGSMTDTLGNI